ncbi:T6SS effector BTH_I2691 family protein, partial [Pseudomonas sp. BCRC 81390]|uniref:T6SS effector BTH_I2691 family protein n=1 Tax=Pseudomonas sp. BCRC 81390 TaxID=3054778 RepID=UPI0025981157
QQACSPFDSAHGFHSRWLRRFALRGYLINAINRHQLENGVLAVVLDDTVGLIQEYNQQRLNWVVKRQAWREEPMRAYQLQTSQILQIIRATNRERAAQEVPSLEPLTGDAPPVFTDPAVARRQLVERKQQESDERLEQRYHEPQRAAFQAAYDQQEGEFQRYIDQDAQAYVALFDTPMFQVVEAYDYDGNDRESGVAYAETLALCLGGGVTEAMLPATEPRIPAAGTSEALWLKWLQDPDSPPYRALLMRDRALLAGLLPSFAADGGISWNDSDKLYSMLSKIIASDDAGLRLRNTLKQAIAETQSALNAASQRLAPCLSPGIQKAVRHLNSATQYLYNGVQLIELEVKMKLGEYYALQSQHLREMQHKANASIAAARDRMQRNLDDFEFGSMKSMRKVRPIIQHGLMSLAVLDPRFTHTMISVTVWVEGTAEEVHGRLFKEASMGVNQASSLAQLALVDISVAAGTLESDARRLLQGMKITSQQAARLVRTGFSGLRGVAGSWEVLLAIGGLYLQQDSLGRNQEKAEAEIGPKAYEAKLALQGSQLGVLGGQIELVGLILRSSTQHIAAPWAKSASGTGVSLIRIGAIISAIAGVFDTVQAFSAAKRAWAAGDHVASMLHAGAGFLYGISTGLFVYAIFKSFLLGPLGLAMLFALGAYALIKQASGNETTALERWARRCYFGKADENPAVHWASPEYADIAFAELNAATLGMRAGIHFESKRSNDPAGSKIGGLVNLELEHKLKFQIVLPKYSDEHSAFRWVVIVHRQGDGTFPDFIGGETLLVDEYQAVSVEALTPSSEFAEFSKPSLPDYRSEFLLNRNQQTSVSADLATNWLEITGTVELVTSIGPHTIRAATLLVMYWPDRSMHSTYIEVCVKESND